MIYIVLQKDFDLLKSTDKLENEGVTVRYCARFEPDVMIQYIATDAPLSAEDRHHVKSQSNFFLELKTDAEFEQWLNEFNPNYNPNPSFRFKPSPSVSMSVGQFKDE